MSETAPNLQDSTGEDLASQIESLLGGSAPAEQSSATPRTQSEKNELGVQVEQMLEDAIDKVNQIAQEVPAQAGQTAGEQSLEAELTAIAEDLSNGGDGSPPPPRADAFAAHAEPHREIATEAAVHAGRPSAPAPGSPPPAAPLVETAPVVVPVSAPVQFSHPVASPTHAAPSAGSPAHAAQSARTAKEPPAPAADSKPRIDLRAALRKTVGRMLTVGGRALAWPLATQKPIVRDSVGWVALVTVFMGACMWAAVLLRDPQPFVPDSPPVSLVTEEGGEGHGKHGSSAKPAGKGSPAGGGAHGAAKAGSHGKKDDGHGAGAAPAAVKREPLIQRGTAKKPAKDAKKDAKKDGGHGGGH